MKIALIGLVAVLGLFAGCKKQVAKVGNEATKVSTTTVKVDLPPMKSEPVKKK